MGSSTPRRSERFLGTASARWNPVPKYVLLIGDGTYDYKNGMQVSGAKNRVPTLMFDDVDDSTYLGRYPSDAWFADVDGSGFPEMAVGRIPAHSYTELAGVLTKLMAYEDQALTGSWYKTQFYIADTYTQAWEQEFETFNNSLIAAYGAPPWAYQQVYYHSPPYNGTDATACAAAIRAAWPNSALIHFDGHSGLSTWGYHTIFDTTDVGLLPSITSAFAPLPFVVNSSCYNSAFDEVSTATPPVRVLMEAMILRSDGGSVGSCGFSTISFPSDEETFNGAIYSQIFGKSKIRALGTAVEAGRFALRLYRRQGRHGQHPPGRPVPQPQAAGPAAPYFPRRERRERLCHPHLERREPGAGLLQRLPLGRRRAHLDQGQREPPSRAVPTSTRASPAASSTATTSPRWTPRVSKALRAPSPARPPRTRLPPQVPTGLTATDTGTGTSASVSWNANTEPDLSGYTLVWGTSSGAYTSSLSLAKGTTSTVVQGLVTNSTYYFAIAAKNTSGLQSAYSAEAICTLTGQLMAINPPGLIVDLKVTRSGQDLVLSWSKPATSLGGTPSDVASFQIYRVAGAYNWNLDTVSQAAPNALVSVPAILGQTAYTYTDTGAMALPNPLTYLVVALDTGGLRSPASNYPPAAILDLKVTHGATGNTLLSFSPVVTDIAGRPLAGISAYRVYGFYPATKTSDQVNPPSPILAATLSPSLPTCEGSAVFCDGGASQPLNYTVVAVDNRGNTSLY